MDQMRQCAWMDMVIVSLLTSRPKKMRKDAWQKKECYFYLHKEVKEPIKKVRELNVAGKKLEEG